jgi:hypothetical protein
MHILAKIGVTMALLLVLGGIGAADALLHGKALPTALRAPAATEINATRGVAKKRGPDVLATLTDQNFALQAVPENNIIQQVVGTEVPAQYRVLLKDGDRAGFLVWLDTPEAKTYFAAIKEALLATLSENVEALTDETIRDEGQPVVNVVSFFDPAISPERIVLIRTQERIYEIHQSPSHQTATRDLIEELVRR